MILMRRKKYFKTIYSFLELLASAIDIPSFCFCFMIWMHFWILNLNHIRSMNFRFVWIDYFNNIISIYNMSTFLFNPHGITVKVIAMECGRQGIHDMTTTAVCHCQQDMLLLLQHIRVNRIEFKNFSSLYNYYKYRKLLIVTPSHSMIQRTQPM